MEEAYNELYQQFLRLRSLCLRQAALLHQLTTAQKKNQGALVANGELSDMTSIPVQCTQEVPVSDFYEKPPQPLAAAAHKPAAQCADWGHMGTFSNVLAEDMAKLSVVIPKKKKQNRSLIAAFSSPQSLDSSTWQAASSSKYKNAEQTHDLDKERNLHASKMPVTDSSSLIDDFLSNGLLMSEVALQSHICEFCQAVFPGDTTTGGEFLRHLHTHIP
ncbi:hypothetical protein Q5P01_001822 [Channa striata]|uniref:Uncharacterized protein n=1 Tax=Channa striata TaxID=64152 RepID=A0AA88NQ58_CHASR|nr:hypothetical protein Q5P01_001822 [Channa striata]